jgi:hypothetical protein
MKFRKVPCKRKYVYTDPDELGYDHGYKGLGIKRELPIDRSKLPLRERKFGDLEDLEEEIKDWKMREYINSNILPPKNLRRKKKSSNKSTRCSCKKK